MFSCCKGTKKIEIMYIFAVLVKYYDRRGKNIIYAPLP